MSAVLFVARNLLFESIIYYLMLSGPVWSRIHPRRIDEFYYGNRRRRNLTWVCRPARWYDSVLTCTQSRKTNQRWLFVLSTHCTDLTTFSYMSRSSKWMKRLDIWPRKYYWRCLAFYNIECADRSISYYIHIYLEHIFTQARQNIDNRKF